MNRSNLLASCIAAGVLTSGDLAHAQLIDTAPQPDAVAVTGCNRGISVHITTSRTVLVTRLEAEINPTTPTSVRFAVWDVATGDLVLYTDAVSVLAGRQFVSSGDLNFSTEVGGDYQIAAMVEACASWYIDTLTTEIQNGIETRADGGIQTTYATPNEPPEDGVTIDARVKIYGFLFDDLDGDGEVNEADNCAFADNPAQEDVDGDGLGDACDPRDDRDFDGDGHFNLDDNCPFDPNPDQVDEDGDGLGEDCDDADGRDADGDGTSNDADNCAFVVNPDQADEDGDGLGDVCDPDDGGDVDGDGDDNESDNCPFHDNPEQEDDDGDGLGDACDGGAGGDDDGDDVSNGEDNCPFLGNPDQADSDDDGVGDACEVTIIVDGSGCATGGGRGSALLVLLIAALALRRWRR